MSAPADVLSLALFSLNGMLISAIGLRAIRAEMGQQHFAAIVESSNDAIVAKDLNGIITAWNQGAERLFGFPPSEALGRPITIIIPDDRQHEEVRVLASVRAGKRIEPFETVRRRKDGTPVHVWVTISPIRDRTGTIVGASKIVSDITERRRINEMREN